MPALTSPKESARKGSAADVLRRLVVRLLTRYRNYSLTLTWEGLVVVLVTLLIGLAAIQTAAPLLYLLFSMMCSFLVLSAFLAKNTLKKIDIDRVVPNVWQAQLPLEVSVTVKNRKKVLSSFSIRVVDWAEKRRRIGAVFFDQIPAKSSIHRTYECLFPRRGLYRLLRLEVGTRFPFGLIERRFFVNSKTELLVLPPAIEVRNVLEKIRAELGEHSSSYKGRGTGLYGLREYDESHPARDIHWKVSARRGQLMVRETEAEEKRRSSVILDNRVLLERQDEIWEDFEKAVILACSAVKWLLEEGHEVELRTASGTVAFDTGMPHFLRCRRALARVEMVDPADPGCKGMHPPDPGAIQYPVLMRGREEPRGNVIPISVQDFDEDLSKMIELPSRDRVAPIEQKSLL